MPTYSEAANRICKWDGGGGGGGGANARMNIVTLPIGSPKILNILRRPYIFYSR